MAYVLEVAKSVYGAFLDNITALPLDGWSSSEMGVGLVNQRTNFRLWPARSQMQDSAERMKLERHAMQREFNGIHQNTAAARIFSLSKTTSGYYLWLILIREKERHAIERRDITIAPT